MILTHVYSRLAGMSATDTCPSPVKEASEPSETDQDCIIIEGAAEQSNGVGKTEKKKRERATEKPASKPLQNRSISAFLVPFSLINE